MNTVREFFEAFISDAQTVSILVLILLDVLFGVMAAIRNSTFAWKKLGRFYQTNVLPYVLGYMVTFPLVFFGLVGFLKEAWLVEVVQTSLILPMVASLLASIMENLQELRLGQPERS